MVVYASEKDCSQAFAKIDPSQEWDPLHSFDSANYEKVVSWISMRCQIMIAALSKKKMDSSVVSSLFLLELTLFKRILHELKS
jgi:hypothetical protein